jgi:hypothetical protein
MDLKEAVAKAVGDGFGVWQEIKPQWTSLGFQGSAYSPNEFILCVLLAQLGEIAKDSNRLKEAVQLGKNIFSQLTKGNVISGYPSRDEIGAIFSTVLVSSLQERFSFPDPPVSEPEVVSRVCVKEAESSLISECPNCGHDFEKCRRGEYAASLKQDVSPVFQQPAIESGEVQSTCLSSCIHVDSAGKCVKCTEDSVIECSDCGEEMIESKAYKCKNYEECEKAYCEDHKENLNEYGYCEDCDTLECDGDDCRESIERGTEHHCANPDCPDNYDYCDDCVKRLLNKDGLCSHCSGEGELVCSSCDKIVTESQFTRCANPDCEDGNGYCPECKDNELGEEGLCDNCS